MNEIEKLYKNAGVKYQVEILDCFPSYEIITPPFTAEKQLSIVKFLLGKSVYYDTDGDREYWFHISDEIENSKYREFDEAIAECINKMWEDLRDYEKVQIKEILE